MMFVSTKLRIVVYIYISNKTHKKMQYKLVNNLRKQCGACIYFKTASLFKYVREI